MLKRRYKAVINKHALPPLRHASVSRQLAVADRSATSLLQVRFNLEKNKVADTFPNSEYDRDRRVPRMTSEEMCEIRKEVRKSRGFMPYFVCL